MKVLSMKLMGNRHLVHMISFFHDDVYDEDEILVEVASKICETLEMICDQAVMFLDEHNEEFTSLKHMLRISSLIEMHRDSGLVF